jgi:hypothetical protein
LKSILPTVTCRPSFSLAIFWIWALGDRRYRQPGDDPESEENEQGDDPTSHPFVLFERSYIHRGSVPQRETKPETRKPGNSTNVSLPGLMAGIRPMPSFRATGSQWFLPCWQQEIATMDPPSFQPLTCTSGCRISENRLRTQACPD